MFPLREDIEKILQVALSGGAEFAELYLEKRITDTVRIEEQLVRESSRGVLAGAGIRAIIGDKVGYAYADGLDLRSMVEAAEVASEIAARGPVNQAVGLGEVKSAEPYSTTRVFPLEIEAGEKIELAYAADRSARARDARITQAMVTLIDEDKSVLIANSEGVNVGDRQILTTLRVMTIAESNGRRQRGFRSLSGRSGYELFEKESPEEVASDAARQAITLLDAREAPAGSMVVVLGNGRGGVLLHEAIGHGFEGDFIRKKTSLFTGRIGEKVAVEGCTIIDDATIPGARGTINVDDEGTPGQRTVLVEDGVLTGFIYDNLNAKLMNTASTGNGRRQAYKFMPVPRQTNTMMLPGSSTPDEIISSVDRGLYAKNIGGGQVDIASGSFVFEVTEGYLIEHGKIGPPVRGANLIGNGAEVLKKIQMIGNDFALEPGGGTCGKMGQAVPVMDGLPTIKISEITVGGTKS